MLTRLAALCALFGGLAAAGCTTDVSGHDDMDGGRGDAQPARDGQADARDAGQDSAIVLDVGPRDTGVFAPDAYEAPDGYELPDAYEPPDAYIVPDAFVVPDAYVAPDAFNCDGDGDGYSGCTGVDCDDSNAAVHPGASEVCNYRDDNCDHNVDEGAPGRVTCYTDADHDGAAPAGAATSYACGGCPSGTTSTPPGTQPDCDDGNASIRYLITVYRDADGDHHCSSGATQFCTAGPAPAGYTFDCSGGSTDCNDSNSAQWVNSICYYDRDHDRYCANEVPPTLCTNGTSCPPEFAQPGVGCIPNDCNDNNPYATDTCRYTVDSGHYGHCCCLGCPQPDPYDAVVGLCGTGFHLESCIALRVSPGGGGGAISSTIVSDTDCRLTQRCVGICDGSTAYLEGTCVAN